MVKMNQKRGVKLFVKVINFELLFSLWFEYEFEILNFLFMFYIFISLLKKFCFLVQIKEFVIFIGDGKVVY